MADIANNLPDRPKTLSEAKTRGGDIAVVQTSRGHMPAFTNMGQVMEYAAAMAGSGAMIRQPLRGNVGACLGIIETASRFGIAPFALAAKAYLVNDNIAYEAQALTSMIYATGHIDGRLKYRFEGTGDDLKVFVTGRIRGEASDLDYESPRKGDIKPQNSPLWKNDPQQQISYFGARAWCRRHAPDLLMGIYDVDEFEVPAPSFVNVTPAKSDPVTRLQANMKAARPAETQVSDPVIQPNETGTAPPEPEPDPPAMAPPAPDDDQDADDDEAHPIAAEAAGEGEPQAATFPPKPGALIRTKKGAMEFAQQWAAYWLAIPKDMEDAFWDETDQSQRAAVGIDPKTEEVFNGAINSKDAP